LSEIKQDVGRNAKRTDEIMQHLMGKS
jgi:hypothetical protein